MNFFALVEAYMSDKPSKMGQEWDEETAQDITSIAEQVASSIRTDEDKKSNAEKAREILKKRKK